MGDPLVIGNGKYPAIDEAIILAIANGSKDALSTLYLQTKDVVYGFALSMLRDLQAAEDVMQETFLQVWSSAGTYVPRGKSPLPWVLGIARNLALARMREDQRLGSWIDDSPEPADPLDQFLACENKIVTRAVLSGLSQEERQIVVLHAVAGLKHREIAALLEMPLSTVLNKYSRSLKKLKELMGEQS